jgi:hypothetical protein
MKVWKIMYGGSVVVGIVVNKDGSKSSDEVLAAWNAANPGYQGESAEEGRFLEV